MIEINGKYTNAQVMIDNVEPTCMSQIYEMVNHPAFTSPIRIMPDTHAGAGSVIGFTMEMTDKIIPNIVGVDIGCGMLSFKVGKNLFASIDRSVLDSRIRDNIPFGSNVRNGIHDRVKFDWKTVNEEIRQFTLKFNDRFGTNVAPVEMSNEEFTKMCTRINVDAIRVLRSIGTLGGGNHFIEIGKDGIGEYWVTIHSGSRNFGKCVAEYWQKRALQRMTEPEMPKVEYVEFVKENFPKKQWQSEIAKYDQYMGKSSKVPKGTEYLEGEDAYGYLVDMMVAQRYASCNRRIMAYEIREIICEMDTLVHLYPWDEHIETVHNFIDFNDWIIRKGAIRSYEGELMVIPWNMEDGLIIAEGKSNVDWNCSAPHGAGRLFSRSKAKATLSLNKAKEDMRKKNIYTSNIPLDECKDAYKDAKVIEACIYPTAEIIHRVRPVMNMKDK